MALVKKRFQPGEYLFRENDLTYFFYFVDEGEVQIAKSGPGGREIPLALLGPGSPVGEFAMIDKQPRSASAIARTVVVASLVSETDYRAIMADLPQWAVSMMTSLVNRLRDINGVLLKNGLLNDELKAEIENAAREEELD